MRKSIFLLLPLLQVVSAGAQGNPLPAPEATQSNAAATAGEPIYNGREHTGYDPTIEGNPYYLSYDWQKGSLVFFDVQYRDLLLKYDLVADELIVRHLNGFSGVTLFTPRIQAFTIGSRQFVNLVPGPQSPARPGIYEQLTTGKLSLFVKRARLLRETIVSTTVDRKFVPKDVFYARIDGVFYPVKKQKALLALTGEKRSEISAWLKASGIKYKTDPEATLTKIAEQYNRLRP